MSENEQDPTRLELTVFNMTFRLRAPTEEHERLARAARHVDAVMNDLAQNMTTPDTARLAVQSAFVITLEYMKLMDDIAKDNGMTNEVSRRLTELDKRLDDSLKLL